jgi:hypothetical protein
MWNDHGDRWSQDGLDVLDEMFQGTRTSDPKPV